MTSTTCVIVVTRPRHTNRNSFEVMRDLLDRTGHVPAGMVVIGGTHIAQPQYYDRGSAALEPGASSRGCAAEYQKAAASEPGLIPGPLAQDLLDRRDVVHHVGVSPGTRGVVRADRLPRLAGAVSGAAPRAAAVE